MTTRQDPFEAELTDLKAPTYWPSLLPDQARQAWADLREWVEHLVDRFGLETRVVPPCWYRHKTLVEALSALRDHERICFATCASPTAAVAGSVPYERSNTASPRPALGPSARSTNTALTPRTWCTDHAQWRTFIEADVREGEQQVVDESLVRG